MSVNRKFLVVVIATIIGSLVLVNQEIQAQTTTGPGEWRDAIWTAAAPPYTNVVTDITINHYVISNSSITFQTPGNPKNIFTINDTLIVYGNLSMGQDDDITVAAGGVLIIYGNFTAVNKVTINNGGYFIVIGDFTMTGGAATSFDNTGGGVTYVTGNVDVSGVGGGGIPVLDCNPDIDPTCGYGDGSDLITDPIFEIIEGTNNVCSIGVSGVVTNVSTAGGSTGAINVTLTGTTAPYIEWSNNANTEDISGLTAGTYTINVQEGSCFVSISFTVTEPGCTAPTITASSGATRCGTGTLSLTATASAGTLKWYNASSGGTLVGTGSPLTTPSISATTIYYVEADNAGCISVARTAVTATVNPLPVVSLAAEAGLDNICDGENTQINLTFTIGTAPFDITMSDGSVSEGPITTSANPYNFIPSSAPVWDIADGASSTITYTLTNVSDANGCSNTGSNTVNVIVNKIPETGNVYTNPNN